MALALSRNKIIAAREHPHSNPLPQAAEGAGYCSHSLSRLRERAGGEAGLSSRMRRARAAVLACKPGRALQVRVAGPQRPLVLREYRAPTRAWECL